MGLFQWRVMQKKKLSLMINLPPTMMISGKDVTLGDPQARLLKYLHKEYLKGNKEYIDTELVLKEAGRKDSRMSDILKKIVDVKDLLFEFTDRFRKVRFNVKHTPPTKRPRIQIKKIN